MGKEEYDITLIGPNGTVSFVSNDHDDAMRIVDGLVQASNGYQDVKIDPPLE